MLAVLLTQQPDVSGCISPTEPRTPPRSRLCLAVKNPVLSDLVGGVQSVTLGDEEAKNRGTQKSVLERRGPATFPVSLTTAICCSNVLPYGVISLLQRVRRPATESAHGRVVAQRFDDCPAAAHVQEKMHARQCPSHALPLHAAIHLWSIHPQRLIAISTVSALACRSWWRCAAAASGWRTKPTAAWTRCSRARCQPCRCAPALAVAAAAWCLRA